MSFSTVIFGNCYICYVISSPTNVSFFLLRAQVFYLGLQIVLRVVEPHTPMSLTLGKPGGPLWNSLLQALPWKNSHLLPRHPTFIKWSYGTICLLLRPSLKPNPLWVGCFVHSSYWISWFSGSFVNSCLGLKILPRVVHSDSLTLHTRSFWKELWICNSIWF